MTVQVPNILKLKYPMFRVTKVEKRLLLEVYRTLESRLDRHDWWGICSLLPDTIPADRLRRKISCAFTQPYLHNHLVSTHEVVS